MNINISAYKHPTGAYLLGEFYHIFTVCRQLHELSRIKIWVSAGLLISNIDIDVDIIDDTFDVSISISTILSYKSIDRGIDDTLLAFFIDITSILLN